MKYIAFVIMLTVLAGMGYAAVNIPTKKMLQDVTVSGDESKHSVTLMIDWPVGAAVSEHIHPGDEYAVVLEGAVEVTTKGQGAKVYKAGEAYHNAKGVVHSVRVVGDTTAKTVATIVAEKGKPLSESVK